MPRKVALVIYTGIGLINIVLGVIYVTSDQFLFYHSQAVGAPWEEIEQGTQTVLLALMKLAGGGWLALGVFTIALALWEFRQTSLMARWVLPAGTLVFYFASLTATWTVHQETGAASPWGPSLVIISLALLALLVDRPWRTRKQRRS